MTSKISPKGDTIVPLGLNDDTFINRGVVVSVLLKFDDILNVEKLRQALQRLLELHNWRKIGSRIRKRKDSRLELHIPSSFSTDRLGFLWSSEQINQPIRQHRVGAQIPLPTGRPSVVGYPDALHPLIYSPKAPKKLDDYLTADIPPLAIRLTTFSDATTVAISWPHVFSDANGIRAILSAWTLILNNCSSDVQPLHGFDFDPLDAIDKQGAKPEDWIHHDYILSKFRTLVFISRFVSGMARHHDFEWRSICLPANQVALMKKRALEDLTLAYPSPEKPHFLTDGDVVAAWLTHLVAPYSLLSPDRTVAIFFSLSVRKIFADLLPTDRPFVGNALSGTVTVVDANEILSLPLSHLASCFRKELNLQATRTQQQSLMSMNNEQYRKGKPPKASIRSSSARVLAFTNWTQAGFFNVDFSGAVLSSIRTGSRDRIGRPSYVGQLQSERIQPRYASNIKGQDAAGNYWIDGSFRKPVWDAIQRDLDKVWAKWDSAVDVSQAAQ